MPLINTGNVAFSYQSTAIETWLFQGPTGPRRRRRAPLRAAPRPTMGGPCVPPSLAGKYNDAGPVLTRHRYCQRRKDAFQQF